MIFKVTSLQRGSKEFRNGSQEGIFIKGSVKTKTGVMEKEMFIAEYFSPDMVAFAERAGVGAVLDFKMKKMEGAKGPYFVPESVKLAEGEAPQAAPPTPAPQAPRPQSAPAPVPGPVQQMTVAVDYKPSVLHESVRYVLGMIGTVIKPAKATPELLDELVVQRFRMFEGLVTGVPPVVPKSSTADLRPKQESHTPPEVPDVPGPDGYDDIPF